ALNGLVRVLDKGRIAAAISRLNILQRERRTNRPRNRLAIQRPLISRRGRAGGLHRQRYIGARRDDRICGFGRDLEWHVATAYTLEGKSSRTKEERAYKNICCHGCCPFCGRAGL